MVLVAAVPVAILGATGRLSSKLDRQAAKWTTSAASTSTTAWRDVPGLRRLRVCSVNQVSATLSVTLRGAPVRFRVLIDSVAEAPMNPGPARFVPRGEESFSYTFVNHTAHFENDDTHVFDVQWRSPSGRRVTLVRGDLNLLFQQGQRNCP